MLRWERVAALGHSRIVAIIRTADAGAAHEAAVAVLGAGITALEVSMTTPGALDVISRLARKAPVGSLIGVGTVLDPETARLALLAGATFVVSPGLARDVVAMAHRYGAPAIPGAATASEVVAALEAGADLVKLFPAAELGVGHLKALRAALPQAPLMPTGGVGADHLTDNRQFPFRSELDVPTLV